MNRLDALKSRCQQYPYRKSAARLTEAEFDMLVAFIDDHDELGHLEFEYAVNRMFLNCSKPKNWTIIQELLTISNTAAKGKSR